MRNPDTLRFAKTHEWIDSDGTVGISQHAQEAITDVVFVEVPKPGKAAQQGQSCAAVESVKAAFDIYAPVNGTVSAGNAAVSQNPALVNKDPYGDGWLFKLDISDKAQLNQLMTHSQYQDFLKTNPH
ncbi:MAG TPA: glycine cleavage system protein GcvH [Elusimicrobiota bacterium]|nr:glycine cleavage system protein GcvH [Elusimicrobiota bacterium]